ncbi:MAG: sucrase ferredoxin [Cyanothece sp. SIO1E1]|nr:sucrase ferredoxin [Cyanothece sp. SIO1E1]
MPTQAILNDCRFCSLVSKANGEDPIGTARTADHWLVFELAQPWTKATFQDDPRIKPLIELSQQLFFKRGVTIQSLLIAPDSDYSRPGKTRVIYYYRPQQQFAQFEKQEFIVPETQFPRLITALLKHLLKQPNELSQFQCYRQETNHIREILVCTHGNIDAACARFGYPIYQQLRDTYAEPTQLRVWRCSHFGGHKFAPTLVDLPAGRYWGHLEPEMIESLVHRQGDVTKLRSFYRGWAGLNKFEQVVEREIWMQIGWDWLSHRISGQTTSKGLKGVKRYLYSLLRLIPLKQLQLFLEQWTKDATWAEVQIQFASPDQTTSGTYSARVEMSDPVMSAAKSPKSGEEIQLQPVPQYRVSHLEKAKQ